eukprot:scaffold281494_cov32-Prasinocladus_malaysianus.AAC.1
MFTFCAAEAAACARCCSSGRPSPPDTPLHECDALLKHGFQQFSIGSEISPQPELAFRGHMWGRDQP